ncbi:MAG: 3-deoxy-8-phosphooctulonate synthase, partial [Sulfurimonadaceae bacterium]|nr:3-deoxy-8-phosphooctulonate synthase [Sulfurimonadaceae bacterium]
GKTGGDSSMVPYLSSAAAAIGVDGYFFETHFDPSVALSDGPNMIRLETLEKLIAKIKKIEEIQ